MAAQNDLWASVVSEVGKRVLESDPSDKPLTFPRLIAALQFAIVGGEWDDMERALVPHRLAVEKAMREDPGGFEDTEAAWWSRMQIILGELLRGALNVSVAGGEDALEGALSEVLVVTAFCERLFGLSEVDIRGYVDEFTVAVQGLTFESERRTIEVDDVLKAMGVFDVDELAKEVTGLLAARATAAASQRREDGLLLRALSAAWGVQATRGWESGPWIVIPAAWRDARGEDSLSGMAADDAPEHWAESLDQAAGGLRAEAPDGAFILAHVPWARAVLQIPDPWTDEVALKWNLSGPPWWIRYGPLPAREPSLFAQRPWLDRARVASLPGGDWVLVDVVDMAATYVGGAVDGPPSLTFHCTFLSFAVNQAAPWGDGGIALLGVGEQAASGRPGALVPTDGRWLSSMEGLAKHQAAELLRYLKLLSEGEEHPVAVQPPQDRQAAPWKKPWLRRDRPYVILLNPTGVARRRAEPGPSTGQRVRLHQRRGHWRHYRSERYSDERRALRQWIRQSWAGDREWATAGSTYRVMTNPDGSLDTGQGG